jgi:hypothetical protein
MSPPISVVIPTYNRAGLIGETLETVLGQSQPPAEVIVVDDGSTDATGEVLARFAGRIRALRIPNSGELAARNTGIAQAKGRLIAFCDSDDLWRPDHLARMAELWRHEPRITAAYANFRIVRDGAWTDRDKFADAPPGYWQTLRLLAPGLGLFDRPIVDLLIRFMPLFPSCMVVRADAFRAVGCWDEAVNRRMSQDLATALRVAEHPPLGLVLEPTVGIRKHAGNFSADTQKMNLGDAAILDYVLRTRPSVAPHAEAIRASIRQRRIAALEIAFARCDFAAVLAVRALLGDAALPRRVRLKAAVAALPAPLRALTARLLLAAGSAKANLAGQGRR